MAVIKAVSSKAGIGQALDYVTKEEKTEDKLVSGLHCEPDTVKDEMQATKELWGKTGGRTYKHFVHSYHEDEHITPEQAHKNAVELAKGTEAWKGHEVLIATHIDRGHIHTHFIVNSVNYENGHKLQWSKADLQNLKDRCNEQSRQQGLHVPEKGKTFSGEEREETVAWNKETYNLLKQAEKGEVKSYVQDTALAVMDCRETATSREDFIDQMKARGYGVDWKDSHKYITFTDLERQSQGEKQCKVRNNKLEKYYAVDFGKESLEHGFEINARREAERTATTERARQQLDRTAVAENSGADERARARQLLDRTAVAEDSSSNKIISAYGITILSTVVGTVCGLSMTILMAYPLSRRDLPGRNGLAFYVFFTMLFSGGLVPTYIMCTRYIKVSNTIWALIIPSLVVNAFYVIMMRTYFSTNIPEAVIEAARIDGAGEFRILLTIVLPMSVPMVATMTLLIGLSYWNDWKNGLYYLQQNKSLYSIQVLLNDMLRDVQALKSGMDAAAAAEITANMPSTGIKMAIAVVGVLPVLIVYPFFQKYFVKGITIGAVKG